MVDIDSIYNVKDAVTYRYPRGKKGKTFFVTSMVTDLRDKKLFVGYDSSVIKVFSLKNIKKRELKSQYVSKVNLLKEVVFKPDKNPVFYAVHNMIIDGRNQYLFASSYNAVYVFSIPQKVADYDKELKQHMKKIIFQDHENLIREMLITNSNEYFITTSDDKMTCVYHIGDLAIDPEEMEKRVPFGKYKDLHPKSVVILVIDRYDNFLITASEQEDMKVWYLKGEGDAKFQNLKNQIALRTYNNVHEQYIQRILICPENRYVFTCSYSHNIKVFDFMDIFSMKDLDKVYRENEELIYEYENVHELGMVGCMVSDDSKFLITVSQDRTMKVFDIQDKMYFKNDPIHIIDMEMRPSTYEFSNNHRYLFIGSSCGGLKILDMSYYLSEFRFCNIMHHKNYSKYESYQTGNRLSYIKSINNKINMNAYSFVLCHEILLFSGYNKDNLKYKILENKNSMIEEYKTTNSITMFDIQVITWTLHEFGF